MSQHIDYSIYIEDLPADCIAECSAPGPADDTVAAWRKELDFTVNRDRAIRCIKSYGAFTAEELASWDDDALAEYILWLACGDFAEFQVDNDSGSDIFVLE